MTTETAAVPLTELEPALAWLDARDRLVFQRPAPYQLPVGVRLDHGDHTMMVAWASYADGPPALFTLDSLRPLTVVEQVRCTVCDRVGWIVRGAWLPAEGGARG